MAALLDLFEPLILLSHGCHGNVTINRDHLQPLWFRLHFLLMALWIGLLLTRVALCMGVTLV